MGKRKRQQEKRKFIDSGGKWNGKKGKKHGVSFYDETVDIDDLDGHLDKYHEYHHEDSRPHPWAILEQPKPNDGSRLIIVKDGVSVGWCIGCNVSKTVEYGEFDPMSLEVVSMCPVENVSFSLSVGAYRVCENDFARRFLEYLFKCGLSISEDMASLIMKGASPEDKESDSMTVCVPGSLNEEPMELCYSFKTRVGRSFIIMDISHEVLEAIEISESNEILNFLQDVRKRKNNW